MRVVILGVGIIVGIRPAVPMRTKHDAFFAFGLIGSDDIPCFQYGSVPSYEVCTLVINLGSKLFQLLSQILSAFFMCFCIRHSRTEIRLCPDVCISTVCIEFGCFDYFFLHCIYSVTFLIAVSARNNGQYKHQEQDG